MNITILCKLINVFVVNNNPKFKLGRGINDNMNNFGIIYTEVK